MDFSSVAAILTDPNNLLMGFVAVLSFATFVTLASPLLSRSTLESRLNSVANRREELKRRSREALAAAKTHGGSLRHADEGWLSATCETMTLHVDMTAKKVAPFPQPVMQALATMKAAHAQLPPPEGAGRRIAMPEKR